MPPWLAEGGAGATMEPEQRFEDLPAWQAARRLAADVLRLVDGWPAAEQGQGLACDLRDAAVRVPSKIANGHARDDPFGFVEQLAIARSALIEIGVRLTIAHDLGLLDQPAWEALRGRVDEVRELLRRLVAGLPDPELEIDPARSLFGEN